jgi:diguanylate cyclase (GGDEF)-like protein/PAS domain S-box-containing protein
MVLVVRMKLKHIISKNIKIARREDLVSFSIDLMKENMISSVVIVDEASKPVDIITEKDIVKMVAKHENINNLKIKDIRHKKELFVQNQNKDMYDAYEEMQNFGYRHIVVTNDEKEIVGVATHTDFLKYLDTDLLMKSKTVEDVMISSVITLFKVDSLANAANLMLENNISSLVIIDNDNHPIGIVTERDMVKYANKSIMEDISIESIIGNQLRKVFPDASLFDVLEMMKRFHIRRVIVVDESEKLVGLVTRNDILKSIRSKRLEFLTANLRQKNFELEVIHQQEEELNLLGIAIKSSPDGIIITDKDAKIKWCNHAFEVLTGYSKFEILGKKPKDLLYSGIQSKEFYKTLWETILDKKSFKGEIKNKKKDGTIYDEKITVTPLIDSYSGEITHFVAVKEDITERNRILSEMHTIAYFDLLTKLPNKFSLANEIEQAILRADRNRTRLTLFILGLDNFKDINESFGHSIGDELLMLISKQIKRYSRKSDFIARVTGDEFAVLIENEDEIDNLAFIAKKLIDDVSKTWKLSNGSSVYCSATIGIATYPEIAKNSHELFQYSDAALFLAKKENKGKYRFYNDEITQKARKNIQTIVDLKESIIQKKFIVLYQPQVEIATNKIIGAESLVRWENKDKIVSPLDFIPLAEERRIISDITEFVVTQTCKDLVEFSKLKGEEFFKVSVNISSGELNDFIVEKIKNILQQHTVKQSNFGIEITESIFIQNIENAVKILNQFKKENFLISMDDFGTGYSSLSYLKQLPIDIIKIDKSFVDGLPSNQNDVQITKTVVSMAKTLGLKTLAEGVETKEQLEFLKEIGCDYYQGYYFSKPIKKEDFLNILKNI